MAFVSEGFEVTFTFVDSGGDVSNRTYQHRAPVDAAAALADAQALLALIEALTDASVRSYRLSEIFADDAFALPAAGIHVENQAIMSVRLSSSPLKTGVLSIPAPVSGMFMASNGANSNVLDTADADVLSFVNQFVPTGKFTLSDGETMAVGGLLSGRRRHVRSRIG